jgi:hypothetical protein
MEQQHQISSIEQSIGELNTHIKELVNSLDNLAEKQDALIYLATYRTDPWSGAMMQAYHEGWIDWVLKQDPDTKLASLPKVREIQKELADDLAPPILRQEQ